MSLPQNLLWRHRGEMLGVNPAGFGATEDVTIMKPKIGVLSTFGADFLSDLVHMQLPLAEAVYVVAPSFKKQATDVFFYPIRYEVGENVFAQILNQVISQLRMSYRVARLTGKVDFWIFVGCDVFLLPVLTAKLLRVKVMSTFVGNLEKETTLKKNVLNPAQILLKKINCALSDRIILYSSRLIKQWGLEQYKAKILIADNQFVDFKVFRIDKPLATREKVIGYVGRLSPEKGVWNLARAVPLVQHLEPGVRFIIVGGGPLYSQIGEYLRETNLDKTVTLAGQVPYSEVPRYLNEMRLYVSPSDTEGMPATILEAMACGTPVLTTAVGAIPDIMVDRETGFIMEYNTPECIAKNIIRALHHPELAEVVGSARQLVESQFSLSAARQKYQQVMDRERS